jgi:hypothetical protein
MCWYTVLYTGSCYLCHSYISDKYRLHMMYFRGSSKWEGVGYSCTAGVSGVRDARLGFCGRLSGFVVMVHGPI